MSKLKYLRRTLNSINQQILKNRFAFNCAFFSHYILKNTIGNFSFIKFPASKFKFNNIILQTRYDTIDFWACLESYEPDLTYFLTKVLENEKGSFIDVGGHIGRFTVLMAKREWDVISFEPVKTNYLALENNLAINDCEEYAETYNLGLGSQTSTRTIYFNPKEMGEASLIQNKQRGSQDEIKIVRFDELMKDREFRELCIVKIDVEGHEESAIEGMKEFILSENPLLIIELWEEHSQNLIQFLKSLGYKRLHVFWFIEPKHSPYIEKMYNLYNKNFLRYDYQ